MPIADQTPVRLYFESGKHHDMAYTTRYPVVGLDYDGRVVVDQSSSRRLSLFHPMRQIQTPR